MDIKDWVVQVTGGNRGLGKALVQAFLRVSNPQMFYLGLQADWDNAKPRV